jgi:hypothetical protein
VWSFEPALAMLADRGDDEQLIEAIYSLEEGTRHFMTLVNPVCLKS